MNIIKCLVILVLSFIVSGVFFYLNSVIINKIKRDKKTKLNVLVPYIFQLLGLIPAIILLFLPVNNFGLFNVKRFVSIEALLITIITIAIVVVLVGLTDKKKKLSKDEILKDGLSGCLMEIMQRFFMQNFIFMFASLFKITFTAYSSIVLNALVWCLGILYQQKMAKKSFDKDFIIEIAASFIFSIGIGYTYFITSSIVLPMLAHFLERVITKTIASNKKGKLVAKTN